MAADANSDTPSGEVSRNHMDSDTSSTQSSEATPRLLPHRRPHPDGRLRDTAGILRVMVLGLAYIFFFNPGIGSERSQFVQIRSRQKLVSGKTDTF